MAMVEEGSQERETFGNAPGWSAREKSGVAPPPASAAPGAPEASPPPDAPAASSAAEEGAAQEAPSEGAPPPSSPASEPTYHVPPKERWDEVIAQRKEAERQRDEALRLAQSIAARPAVPTAPAQPVRDPWEGLVNHADPATAQFYQQMRAVVSHEREQAKQEAIAALAPVIDAGRQEIARLNTREFRKENPDIKPGSEEERLIVAYMSGQVDGVLHPLDSAKRNALFDRLETENRALKAKASGTPQKRAAANIEATSGIPATAGLPPKPGDWRERAGSILDQGGDMVDVAKALFGGRKRIT